MHVGVADEHIEDQSAQKPYDSVLTASHPEHVGNVAITGPLVLSIWVYSEDLRKVFYVYPFAVGCAVESLYSERFVADELDARGQTFDVTYRENRAPVSGISWNTDQGMHVLFGPETCALQRVS